MLLKIKKTRTFSTLLQCQAMEILTSIALESCVFMISFHDPALQGPCLSS